MINKVFTVVLGFNAAFSDDPKTQWQKRVETCQVRAQDVRQAMAKAEAWCAKENKGSYKDNKTSEKVTHWAHDIQVLSVNKTLTLDVV